MREILWILVIYGIRPEESAAYRSLVRLMSEEERQDSLYIHDNTARNVYLSGAYNAGLKEAEVRNKQWLVLLDDDTELTEEYMRSVREGCAVTSADVLVPQLVDQEGKVLSPFRRYGRQVAFNSGVVIRRSVLEETGGFSADYPLDYLDYWLFRELQRRRKTIATLDVRLCHQLSITDYSHVSRERYASILSAERRFAREEGPMAYRMYRWRLLGRAIKWTVCGHVYSKETWKAWIQ